jgi:hypothetical protein
VNSSVHKTELDGACHCGAIRVRFQSTLPLAQIQVRACQCSFCRTHGALSVSDPQGRLIFEVADPKALLRYRFGLKLSDFLVCARCGVYLGVYMDDPGGALGVLNLNVLKERDRFPVPTAMDYEGESVSDRLQRRRARWTPAQLELA